VATFLVDFSQSHLVTLVAGEKKQAASVALRSLVW
jgi:hypothetical protein